MTIADIINQTPPAPTAGDFDAAVARALGWRNRNSAANARRRLGLAAKVEPDTRCRWCGATMTREYALRCCSRLCRDCSAEAGRSTGLVGSIRAPAVRRRPDTTARRLGWTVEED